MIIMKIKRITSFILIITIVFSLGTITAFASAGNSGYTSMKKLSKQEIVKLSENTPVSDTENIYIEVPSVTAPYSPGKVKDDIVKAGLDRLNAYRRLAGLKNVTISNEYTDYAQAAAVITAANKKLSHAPSKPAGMPEDLFEKGYKGAVNGTLSYFYGKQTESGPLSYSVDMWMNDSDDTNIDRLGHRRWLLNPTMGSTGFGNAHNGIKSYSSLYAFDKSAKADDFDFISWPPSGYMVSDTPLFTTEHAWSISLNPGKYSVPDMSAVSVEIKSENGTYNFSKSSSDGYFNINTQGFGVNNAIIFRPENIDEYNGEYKITIKGLKTASGQNTTLTYTVDFFRSDEVTEEPSTSTAETGDINNDGKISASDARLVLRAAAKLEHFNSEQTQAADVNGDNKITASDARKILRVSAKLDTF
jgi:uncharacterized protein YkwD